MKTTARSTKIGRNPFKNSTIKKCPRCGRVLPKTEFYFNGLDFYCRDCRKYYRTEYKPVEIPKDYIRRSCKNKTCNSQIYFDPNEKTVKCESCGLEHEVNHGISKVYLYAYPEWKLK